METSKVSHVRLIGLAYGDILAGEKEGFGNPTPQAKDPPAVL